MLFVMELSTRWRPELTWRAFFACAACAYCIMACVGNCSSSQSDRSRCAYYTAGGLLSVPDLAFKTHLSDAVPVAVLGVLGGLGGALFNRFHVQVRLPSRRSVTADRASGADARHVQGTESDRRRADSAVLRCK